MTQRIDDAAMRYLGAGMCVLPADRKAKRPTLSRWQPYIESPPTEEQLDAMLWDPHDAICIVCGLVSGNLEMIDFDLQGVAFEAWKNAVREHDAALYDTLVIETTPAGGRHVVYRCVDPVGGNAKLAHKIIEADGEIVEVAGKSYPARRNDDGWHAKVCVIETRGQGGQFLCAPSDGYSLQQGSFDGVPTITRDQRDMLIGCARALDEDRPAPIGRQLSIPSDGRLGMRPGDEFNARGDMRALLVKHGWRKIRDGENEHWCRPGKEHGTSATLKDGNLFVFTSSAAPLEPNQSYSAFGLYGTLEHAGDWSSATKALAAQGYGSPAMRPMPRTAQAALPKIAQPFDFKTASQLRDQYPQLRPPLIEGILRRGETMNIIASPKVGKSWMVNDLAICVAMGQPWLGMPTVQGKVLILDNELHPETMSSRIATLKSKRSWDDEVIDRNLHFVNLRGGLLSIEDLDGSFVALEPDSYSMIVLDAYYRFLPVGVDENDNGAIANIYNLIDRHARSINASFVLIHHTSKGGQAEKSVTDVGSGAGSQSRATDTHLVLRHHKEEGVIVVDAAVRSWKPIEPFCLRWNFPLWERDTTGLDPADLRRPERKKRERGTGVTDTDPPDPYGTADAFQRAFIAVPSTRAEIVARARQANLSARRANAALASCLVQHLVTETPSVGARPATFTPVVSDILPNGLPL